MLGPPGGYTRARGVCGNAQSFFVHPQSGAGRAMRGGPPRDFLFDLAGNPLSLGAR